jgi:hypothetical protein
MTELATEKCREYTADRKMKKGQENTIESWESESGNK